MPMCELCNRREATCTINVKGSPVGFCGVCTQAAETGSVALRLMFQGVKSLFGRKRKEDKSGPKHEHAHRVGAGGALLPCACGEAYKAPGPVKAPEPVHVGGRGHVNASVDQWEHCPFCKVPVAPCAVHVCGVVS